MTKQEIETGNVLIAQFMGWIPCQRCTNCGAYQSKEYALPYLPNEMTWSEDWNEIMPVVEKIERLGYDTSMFCNNKANFSFSIDDWVGETIAVNSGTIDEKLLVIYSTVIQFINWHDQQSPNPIEQ